MSFPGSIPLCTRMGREIPNEQFLDVAPEVAERETAALRRRFPFVILRRPPSGLYNCHGLTFANRRTGIQRPEAVQEILKDDGYKPVRVTAVQPGDVVVYRDGPEISHTGLVLKVVEGYPEGSSLRSVEVLSKWGYAGEYYHPARESPYHEQSIEYWTDRL